MTAVMGSGWRIVKESRAADAFDGEGARRYGGRWNSPGVAVVYLSEHLSLAALEVLVHTQPLTPSQRYRAFRVEWDESLEEKITPTGLPIGWQEEPPGPASMRIGDKWARENRTPILAVPSCLIPLELNFLYNPAHPNTRRVRIGEPREFIFDPRLIQQ